MAKTKTKIEFVYANTKMTVKWIAEWGEWVVQTTIDGKLSEDLSYHTEDYDDCLSTFGTMVQHFMKNVVGTLHKG